MKTYKIGDISRLLGLTTQALRFYEQKGLVAPLKTENGTRYFTPSLIVCLLAFRKYKMSDFTMQDVAAHFKEGSLPSLVDHLDSQIEALMAQSELLVKRARAIRHYERTLRDAMLHMEELLPTMRPELYIANLTFDALDDLTAEQVNTFNSFADAMPDTNVCYLCDFKQEEVPEFRFCASLEAAKSWALPLEEACFLPSVPCIGIYIRTAETFWDKEYLKTLISRVESAGYRIHTDERILYKHLVSETINGTVYLCGMMYIPVVKN